MTPLWFTLLTLVVSFCAGVFGALLGLGGGIIVVPFLTLWMGVDIRHAVGASLVCVIATSSGAAAAYVRERMTNLRVAMFLEIATAAGAISGAFLAGVISVRWLYVVFSLLLGYSALMMLKKRHAHHPKDVKPDPFSDRLALHGSYFEESAGKEIAYRVTGARVSFALMYVAGILSGLLGIGSGVLKVPAMDLVMGLPIKVSTATSNFMMGVTAAASAAVYFSRGDIDPFIAAPVMTGVLCGAMVGSRLLGKMRSSWIRIIFVLVLLWAAAQMLYKGLRG